MMLVDERTDAKEIIIEDEEVDELSVEDMKGQVYRLTTLITRIESKIGQSTRYLDMSRSISKETQALIDIGISYYDLDSQYEVRI
jgi:hypothetical protein